MLSYYISKNELLIVSENLTFEKKVTELIREEY